MKLSKNVLLSCEILAAHKLRTGLSVLGIVVGIAAVVLMVSVGKGIEKQIVDRIKGMGTNLIVVNAGQTRIVAGRQRQLDTVTTLLPADAEAVARECPSVALAAPVAKKKLPARWESENSNTLVMGTTPDGFDIRNITPRTPTCRCLGPHGRQESL
jgi:putative ABC transport system permease protein